VLLQDVVAGSAMNRAGDSVVGWDVGVGEIRARILQATVFQDGFESGYVSAWSRHRER
jgi:hypothetical protein